MVLLLGLPAAGFPFLCVTAAFGIGPFFEWAAVCGASFDFGSKSSLSTAVVADVHVDGEHTATRIESAENWAEAIINKCTNSTCAKAIDN